MRLVREILITALLALLFFMVFRITVQSFRIYFTSMEPNFHPGQYLMINKAVYIRVNGLGKLFPSKETGYLFHPPRRGEVVLLRPPNNPKVYYIKRVIGLPGETIEVKGGAVYVNGKAIVEPYIKERPLYTLPPTPIPPDHYFVLGDNRNTSVDSHYWEEVGPIPSQNIVGKAWFSYWPLSYWGGGHNYSF